MFAEKLRSRLAGVAELADEQIARLEAHYNLLLRWNRTVNLTTVTSMKEAVERHYCESLFLAAHLPERALRIADVGSGAGFPGFPVAIVRPDCSVTLIESHQRKAVFLKEASRSQTNIRVLAKRAEDVREEFDWVISRAVSYSDLVDTITALAGEAALLTGAEAPPAHMALTWQPAVPMPWGEHRFLRLGHT
ncbi:MAG: 16S rRNA (guanine(527)-N(7))-methyltransferase RsmG [Acidobacteriia bacterium]|nr:16S rRNA (guanine(527)-N(7))-methyltransferase RsmG [Terriglobia bacterium]